MKIRVTGCQHTRSLSALPNGDVVYRSYPPRGVSNWQRVSGPHPIDGGEKVTVSARWMCLQARVWRTMYSDGSFGPPVGAEGPWNLQRGPREIFQFQYQLPANPRFIGEIVTFELDMEVRP